MKIIHKKRLSIKDLLEICKIDEKSWFSKMEIKKQLPRWAYWLSILGSSCNANVRKYNSVYLAINDNGNIVGYLMAYVASKPKVYHPVLLLIYILYYFIFLFLKAGRLLLSERRLYYWQWAATVKIGKQYLAGKKYKKISEGVCVAIYPEYRKQGVYRELTKKLFGEVDGYYIFQTTTESVYQAHEAMGYKKIFEAPFFYPEKDITFIMYGDKHILVKGNKNSLKEGQIYTLNDGVTYDIIHEHFEDGSGSWCYDIVLMKDLIDEKTGEIRMHGGGDIVDQEDCSLDEIRERGVLIGQLGETHFFNPDNNYRLERIGG
jgi:ribosomal protein S18 acetylase RimI-like enzyme